MSLSTTVVALVSASALALSPAAVPAESAPCVRVDTTCFATVQGALDAAPPGATVSVPAGRFPGGVTIEKPVTLKGAGASKTVFAGGEHVVSVGTLYAPAGTQPTVTISGVTITGGRATDMPGADYPGIDARGAGVLMLPDEEWGGGALTILDSVITGNLAQPSAVLHPLPEWTEFWPVCPDGYCTYAGASGAGIDARGSLTLVRTTVSDNESSGALVSDAVGGGIAFDGSLTLVDSTVKGNRALGRGAHARYAEGGGIFGHTGSLSLLRSSVSGNESALHVTWPIEVDGIPLDTLANGGGIHLGDGGEVTVRASHIDGNRTTYDNPNGNWGAINAGAQLGADTTLVMSDSTVSGNVLVARLKNTEASGPIGGAIEWDGDAKISGSRFVGNTVTATALDGDAAAAGAVSALSILAGLSGVKTVMTDSVVSGNVVTAKTTTGAAQVVGVGILSETDLTLTRVLVAGNRGNATGDSSTAVGGGIATGALLPGTPDDPAAALRLDATTVSGNRLTGPHGASLSGGGIYSTIPVTVNRSVVAGNAPDQCIGCGSAPQKHIVGSWRLTWPQGDETRLDGRAPLAWRDEH